MRVRLSALALSGLLLALVPADASAQATIQIFNFDDPAVGFNDPAPAVPAGGNPGTTVGEQRIHAFLYAAGIWGQTLTSPITIRIAAFFEDALACTATTAVLGVAAP